MRVMYSCVCSWWYVWQFSDGRVGVIRYVCVCVEGKGEEGGGGGVLTGWRKDWSSRT